MCKRRGMPGSCTNKKTCVHSFCISGFIHRIRSSQFLGREGRGRSSPCLFPYNSQCKVLIRPFPNSLIVNLPYIALRTDVIYLSWEGFIRQTFYSLIWEPLVRAGEISSYTRLLVILYIPIFSFLC